MTKISKTTHGSDDQVLFVLSCGMGRVVPATYTAIIGACSPGNPIQFAAQEFSAILS